MERDVAFKALVGSYNYLLNDATSDRDFKVFVFPTFDDLYRGFEYAKDIVGEKEDLNIHDIRRLPDFLYKSNVNFLEVLFSRDITFEAIMFGLNYPRLFEMRENVASINLPHLYDAVRGNHLERRKSMERGKPSTKDAFMSTTKYGYNTKEALHAYRLLDLFIRYYRSGFKSFESSLRYEGKEKEFMMSIKNGAYSKQEMLFLLDKRLEEFESIKEVIRGISPSTKLYQEMQELVKRDVKKYILTKQLG